MNKFCPEISLPGACVKSALFVLHLTNGWTNFISLPSHKPRLNMFCPEICLVGGLCKISPVCTTPYKLMNKFSCTTGPRSKKHPSSASATSLLPPVVQPAAPGDCEAIGSCAMVSFGLNSPHCQKVKTQNLVLQEHLESIGAPLNTKASRTHHGQKQTESGKPSLNRHAAHFISLSAHKPRLNQFCPAIPLMGACVCNP